MISYYNTLPPKGQPHISSGEYTIEQFIGHIKFGTWRHLVEPIRNEQDKERRTILKRSLPSVTISGVFKERNQNALIKHSGFIAIDVDNFTDKSKIDVDAYTYAVIDSCSGLGFFVLVKVDPAKHKESFKWLQKYYYETFGIVVDSAPQNIASLRYVSYDPKFEVNEKSKVSKVIVKEDIKPKSLPIVLTGESVNSYVHEAVTRGANIASSYNDYLNLSFALVDGFGEGGRNYFHSLCSVDSKYNEAHANKQYDIAIKRGKSGVTVGTFYHMLKMAGIAIKAEKNNVLAVTVMGKSSGRTQEAVVKQLTEINGIEEAQAVSIVSQVFERNDITLQTVAYDPEKLIETLKEFIEQNHPIRRNSITRILEENGKDVTEERLNTIFLRARAAFNTPNITFDLVRRMICSEFTPDFHPITDYIEKNSWRGSTGNLQALINCIKTDSVMSDVMIRKWCISIIAAYDGFAVRGLLALLGGQFTGKTEFFRRLLPNAIKRYYGESRLDAGKDDELLMCSKLVLVNDEMGGKSKHDEKLLKELTSKSIFSLRAPYGRHNEDFKRLAVLGGTSNEEEIMNDPTGNTRIYPIVVKSIDHELYNSIDKDELFMELYRLYDSGERWELTNEENAMLMNLSKSHEGINYERECILEYFTTIDQPGFKEELTAVQIKNYIESNGRQQIKNMKAFGMQLKTLFGKSYMKRGIGYVYPVIKKIANTTYYQPVEEPVKIEQIPVSKPIVMNMEFDGDLPF